MFALAAQFCGAISTPEWLAYMDYFVRREYGDDYYLHPDAPADLSSRSRTVDKVITDAFEQVVYSLNQPAAARGNPFARTSLPPSARGFMRETDSVINGSSQIVWLPLKFSPRKTGTASVRLLGM